MKLEQLVTSLEISKRLKERGVKQESLFYWDSHALNKITGKYGITSDGEYSAFTAGELGELLPAVIRNEDDKFDLWFLDFEHDDENGWVYFYRDRDGKKELADIEEDLYADTKADARGKMLIYLIKNGLWKAGKEESIK